jgi:hypothetical protein
MEELVQMVSAKTGLSADKSQEVVTFIINHLKERLPAPVASSLDSYLAGGSADGDSLADKAKAMVSGLGGMFGQKSE